MTATQRPAAQKHDVDGTSGSKSSSAKAQNDLVSSSASTTAESPATNGRPSRDQKVAPAPTILEWAALALLIFLTYFFMPHPLHPVGEPSIHHVFYYGWLTAVSTGLGVVPLIFAPNLAAYWVGVSNGKLVDQRREEIYSVCPQIT